MEMNDAPETPQEAAPAVSEGVRTPSSLDDPTLSKATTG